MNRPFFILLSKVHEINRVHNQSADSVAIKIYRAKSPALRYFLNSVFNRYTVYIYNLYSISNTVKVIRNSTWRYQQKEPIKTLIGLRPNSWIISNSPNFDRFVTK